MSKRPFVPSSARFHVAPKCPCGKSNRDGKFNPFRGYRDKGFCHSCGVTFYPDDATPDQSHQPGDGLNGQKVIFRQDPMVYVKPSIVKATLKNYEQNNLYVWFKTKIGGDETAKVFQRFNVGTARKGGTIFWLYDQAGRIFNGQRIIYKHDGHRDKSQHPFYVYKSTEGFGVNCFFGEHQINEYPQSAIVNIVESPKTVLLAYWKYPDKLWISACGSRGCTVDKAAILRNRRVRVWPDMHKSGREAAENAAKNLGIIKAEASVVQIETHRNDGGDLGDLIVEEFLK